MNQVFLGTYKENEFETLMSIAQLIRSKGYRTTQIEEYDSKTHIYFINDKDYELDLKLSYNTGDIELIGDDIMFMTNIVFSEINKVKEDYQLIK